MVFRAGDRTRRHVTQFYFGCIGDMANAPLQLHPEKKKLFLYVRDQQIFTRCCFFLLSLAGLLFFLPLPNCDFFLLQSQKISPNQFADLFTENFTLFHRCRLTHTHTHVRGRDSSTEKYTPRNGHDRNSSYKGSQTVSHALIQIVAGRCCTLPRRVDPFFFAAVETDCKKMVTTRWWLKQIR